MEWNGMESRVRSGRCTHRRVPKLDCKRPWPQEKSFGLTSAEQLLCGVFLMRFPLSAGKRLIMLLPSLSKAFYENSGKDPIDGHILHYHCRKHHPELKRKILVESLQSCTITRAPPQRQPHDSERPYPWLMTPLSQQNAPTRIKAESSG